MPETPENLDEVMLPESARGAVGEDDEPYDVPDFDPALEALELPFCGDGS